MREIIVYITCEQQQQQQQQQQEQRESDVWRESRLATH